MTVRALLAFAPPSALSSPSHTHTTVPLRFLDRHFQKLHVQASGADVAAAAAALAISEPDTSAASASPDAAARHGRAVSSPGGIALPGMGALLAGGSPALRSTPGGGHLRSMTVGGGGGASPVVSMNKGMAASLAAAAAAAAGHVAAADDLGGVTGGGGGAAGTDAPFSKPARPGRGAARVG
jgi:hypothetical protein